MLSGLMLALAAQQSLAAMYKWTDEEGNVHYTQHPPTNHPTEVIKPPPPAPSNRGYTPPSLSDGEKKEDAAAEDPEQAKMREEIARKNCEAARKNVEVLTAHRRIRESEGGEVIVLDDKERQRRVEEARKDIKENCK
jgi:hypothetical protein